MSGPDNGEGFSSDSQRALKRLDAEMDDHMTKRRGNRFRLRGVAIVAAGLAAFGAIEAATSHSDVIRNPEQAATLMLKATDGLAHRISTTQPREDGDIKITATEKVVDRTKMAKKLSVFDKTVDGQSPGCIITLTTTGPAYTGRQPLVTDDIRVTIDDMSFDMNPTNGTMSFDGLPPSNEGIFGYPAPGPGPQSLHFSRDPDKDELPLTSDVIEKGADLVDSLVNSCLDPGPSDPNQG